jgi:NADH dehydrogenase/NADH:ubiquinone oxidoreductase subunit G
MNQDKKITIEVDGRQLEVAPGISVLQACLENGITIPNLCWMESMTRPPASCRLCFVQVEGRSRPQTSCTLEVEQGMAVRTDTEEVRELQRSAFELLMSVHDLIGKDCPGNKRCELQRIAKFLKVSLRPKNLPGPVFRKDLDSSHPCLIYDPNRCVLCGRCVHVCAEQDGAQVLSFAFRGIKTEVSFYGAEAMEPDHCLSCLACVRVCPVAALTLKQDYAAYAALNAQETLPLSGEDCQ